MAKQAAPTSTPLARFINKNRKTLKAQKNTKDPFGNLKAPDGNYYAQVKRVGIIEQKDRDNPGEKISVFSIQTVIVCNENGEADGVYVGEQPRIENRFQENDTFTIEDITQNMYINMQRLDCDTSLIIMDESERENDDQFTLETAMAYAQFISNYVHITISTSAKGYRNTRLNRIVDYEELVAICGLELPAPRTDEEFAEWWNSGGQPEEPEAEREAEDEQEEYEEEGTDAEEGEEGAEALEDGGEEYEEYEEAEEVEPAPTRRQAPAKKAAAAKAAPAKGPPPRKGPPQQQQRAAAPAKKAVAAKKAPPTGKAAPAKGPPPRKGPPRR